MSAASARTGLSGAAPSHQVLLLALRRIGPMTSTALAACLGLSRSAVLGQLRALADAGMVERRVVRHGVGRPRHLYDVAPPAQGLLPAGYEELSTSLLEAAREVGGSALVERVFDARRVCRTKAIRDWFRACGMDARNIHERLCELAALQDQLGYVCEVSREGAIRLHEHNCPILSVATRFPGACESELRLFSDVLEADVRRESHLAGGDRSCTFRIEPRAWDSRGWDLYQYYYSHTPTPRDDKR